MAKGPSTITNLTNFQIPDTYPQPITMLEQPYTVLLAESIEHFLSLYPNIRRERIILIGHSMGGVGAYRLSLLKPDYFRALVILAGPLDAGFLEQMEKFRNQNLFLVYGARDKVEWVSDSRAAVEKLTAVGAVIEYIELPDAGPMLDGAPWSEVIDWIMKYSE